MLCQSSRLLGSGEESHVGTTHLLVGIASRSKQPLGEVSLDAVSAEEIVEDGRVQRSDLSLLEIVVVGANLGALEVVRRVDVVLNDASVLFTERIEAHLLALEVVRARCEQEAVELLLLVSLTRLLDDDVHRKVLKKALLEVIESISLRGVLLQEVGEEISALTVGIGIAFEGAASLRGSMGRIFEGRKENARLVGLLNLSGAKRALQGSQLRLVS